MSETNWVVPDAKKLDAIMAQIVLNATEFTPQEAQGTNGHVSRSVQNLNFIVAQVRASVQAGRRTPLSQLAGSVPPEAELHCYILTVNLLTAGKPNMGAVVLTLNGGVISPFMDLVKRANKWLDAAGAGTAPFPTDPSLPVVAGIGFNLVGCWGTPYPAALTVQIALVPGKQYVWTPGPNEVSLTNGALVLNAAGSFYAQSTAAIITGNLAGNIVTGSIQKVQPDVNYTRDGRLHGRNDMTGLGPYGQHEDRVMANFGTLLLIGLLLLSGCATPTAKPSAGDLWPNGWNGNVYTGQGKPYYSFGVSGTIPPWMNPFTWLK